MASWKSTGTYVDEVPPPGANIIDVMWIFIVKRPPDSPPAFKTRYVARGFTQRDYELHSLDFSTAFLQGSLHEEIRLRRPPGFTGSFPAGSQWSLRPPVFGLCQAPREWHDTLRTTLAAFGFAPSPADPTLFLRTYTTLPSFYVLVYVDDLVLATADTEVLTLFSSPQPTPLSTGHSLSAPSSDESVEPSGLYPELVGCLMYLMTCTRPDLAYPLSLMASYGAPARHRKVHWDAAKRVLRYLCCTSSMGLVLGGRDSVVLTGHSDASWADDQATQHSSQGYTFYLGSGSVSWRSTRSSSVLGSGWRSPVVLTGHADASWVDDLATQRSSQGYTFSLGSGFVSWRSTRSSSFLISSCEAEIYAGAMAAQELRWLTYLLTDLGEPPRSPPVLSFIPVYSHTCVLLPVTMEFGAAGGGDTGGADSWDAGSGGAASPTGAGGAGGGVAGGSAGGGAGGAGARRQETLSPEQLREWAVRWGSPGGGAGRARAAGFGGTGLRGASAGVPGVGRAGGTGAGGKDTTGGIGGAAAVGVAAGSPGSRSGGAGPRGASAGVPGVGLAGGTGTGGTCATRVTGGAGPVGASAVVPGVGGTGGADTGGATGGTGVGGARRQESPSPQQLREWAVRWGSPGGGAGGAGLGGVVPTGARGSGGVTTQPQLSVLRHLLSLPPAATEFSVAGTTPPLLFPPTVQSQPQLVPCSPLPAAPAPHTAMTDSVTEHREPAPRPVMPVCSRRGVHPCPPPVPGTHIMALCPSFVPQRIVLPSPLVSSLPHVPDPESDLVRTASPTITHLLAKVVTDHSLESAATSALVAELVNFAALCCLDYAARLVFDSSCPPSVGGELALGCDVLEDM
ncbi:unnamed protein product [Closterium sp. NIES-54]